jgi:hypothetical protein
VIVVALGAIALLDAIATVAGIVVLVAVLAAWQTRRARLAASDRRGEEQLRRNAAHPTSTRATGR